MSLFAFSKLQANLSLFFCHALLFNITTGSPSFFAQSPDHSAEYLDLPASQHSTPTQSSPSLISEFESVPFPVLLWRFFRVWTQRVSILLAVMTLLPWVLAVLYDILLYVWRCILFELLPFIGGQNRERARDTDTTPATLVVTQSNDTATEGASGFTSTLSTTVQIRHARDKRGERQTDLSLTSASSIAETNLSLSTLADDGDGRTLPLSWTSKTDPAGTFANDGTAMKTESSGTTIPGLTTQNVWPVTEDAPKPRNALTTGADIDPRLAPNRRQAHL